MTIFLPNIKSLEKRSFFDASLQESFDRDGYLVLEHTIEEPALNVLTNYWAMYRKYYQSKYYISTIELDDINHRREANELFRRATEALVAELFVDYTQFYGGYGVKMSLGESSILDTHQDMTMVPYDGNRTGLTLWFSLMDVDEQSGCLQVVPGSHRYNRLPRGAGCDFAYEDHRDYIDRECMLSLPARKGQVIIMDQATIHRSGPNTSGMIRVAAMGMFKPVEDKLVYYHKASDDTLDVYEPPDDFYLYHKLCTQPREGKPSRTEAIAREPYLWF